MRLDLCRKRTHDAASALAMHASKSFASRWQRLRWARVRSMTQRRGSRTNPLAVSERLMMSIFHRPCPAIALRSSVGTDERAHAARGRRRSGDRLSTLVRWIGRSRDRLLDEPVKPGSEDVAAELKRLRREDEILRQERDILKRYRSFISRMCKMLGVSPSCQ